MNKILAVAGLLAVALVVSEGPTMGQTIATSMQEHERTNPPIGYVQFCQVFADDCGPFETGAARVHLTMNSWRQLVDVNDHVNAIVEPATDLELYGVEEWWTYPIDNRGDCEDYVLLKRKLLLEKGWPASALLITVVRDEFGDGHAVLTVTTSAGDLILDNQNPDIHLWSETPYGFLMRQSARDPNMWVSLRDGRHRPDLPVAGVENR